MQRHLRNTLLPNILAWLCLACPIAWAETGILVVHVEDVHGHPVAGLKIGVKGDGGSAFTEEDGRARIRLANQTQAKSFVSLQIVKSPPGKDLVMVSPWDSRTQVPSFENESDNFVEVVVVQLDDREALLSGTVLKAAVQQINKANAPKSADKQAAPDNPKANLEAVAKQYGLSPDDLDKAIRAWGEKTNDPYEAGLAALYARNYDKATTDLQTSLINGRRNWLRTRSLWRLTRNRSVMPRSFWVPRSTSKASTRNRRWPYQRCLQIRPDDATVLNNTALSLMGAGDYAGAEPLYRRALAIDEKALGPDHPDVARGLNNLAVLLYAKATMRAPSRSIGRP